MTFNDVIPGINIILCNESRYLDNDGIGIFILVIRLTAVYYVKADYSDEYRKWPFNDVMKADGNGRTLLVTDNLNGYWPEMTLAILQFEALADGFWWPNIINNQRKYNIGVLSMLKKMTYLFNQWRNIERKLIMTRVVFNIYYYLIMKTAISVWPMAA